MGYDYNNLMKQLPAGPWRWSGPYDNVSLTADPNRRLLGCKQFGPKIDQGGAQFWFGDFSHKAKTLDGSKTYKIEYTTFPFSEVVDINHPLAQLIKRIPDMVMEINYLRYKLKEKEI